MRTRIFGIIVILLIVGAIIATQTLFIVDETNQAIILQFGEPIKTVQTPGLNTKLPFVQNVTFFDKKAKPPAIGIYVEALSQDPEFYAVSRRLEAYAGIINQGDTVPV